MTLSQADNAKFRCVPPRDEASYHEAAHAVVAVLEGAELVSIEAGQLTERLGGRVGINCRNGALSVRSQALITMAGIAGQMLRILLRDWDGEPPAPINWLPPEVLCVNGDSDLKQLESLLGKSARHKFASPMAMGALAEAIRYVSEPRVWGKIEALAAELRLADGIDPQKAITIVHRAGQCSDPRLESCKIIAVFHVHQLI